MDEVTSSAIGVTANATKAPGHYTAGAGGAAAGDQEDAQSG